ncbi:MAG: ABC transporter ATP-binding protein [Flavobacteriales bacterium]
MKQRVTANSFIRLIAFVRPYKKLFFIALLAVITLSILGPLRPYLIGKAVDQFIVKEQNSSKLMVALLGVLSILLIETFIIWASAYTSNLLAQSVIRDLRTRVFNKVLSFKTRYFDKTPVGSLVTRVVSDVESISEVFSAGLMEIFGDLLSLIAILGFMFWVDWRLSLLTLIPIPILILATNIFAKAMKKSFQSERTQVSRLNTFVQEHLMGMSLIQLFAHEQKEALAFKSINEKHRDAHISAVWANSIFFPVVELLSSLSIAFLLVWGAMMVEGRSQQQLTQLYGEIIAFTLWINQLYRPIRQLADKFNIFQRGVVRAERLFEILDEEEEVEPNEAFPTPFSNGDIEFHDVSFSYTSENPLLSSFNLLIPAGKTTALVGATGSGKTTIINLIGRFYEINAGKITINGVDLNQITRSEINKHIGVVLQDVFLFSDTIHNNITLGNPTISRERVIRAAQQIGAHDFIMKIPGEYDYVIGERGGVLSVGQRQLLAFIRAMVYEPVILILDEATSSIDSESELLIQKAIAEVTKNRTSIIIAHRLSTIQQADQIHVMEKGQIIQTGTHSSLLAVEGAYKTLFEKQFNELDEKV